MDESGEVMKAALPHFLPQPRFDGREPDRLDLARWLVSPENPLPARAVMNRLWKQFFGIGLSKVLDDLGAQGEPPANPALLDWLATEFRASGWDVKHMVRTIVTSATYRQTSTATPEQLAADPYNRELARQTAFRVEAESVRDTALAVSGLLVAKIGGPSVKPYQPEGYWGEPQFPDARLRGGPGRESVPARGLTPGGSGRSCIRACWRSMRPTGRNAPPNASFSTCPSRRSSCSTTPRMSKRRGVSRPAS